MIIPMLQKYKLIHKIARLISGQARSPLLHLASAFYFLLPIPRNSTGSSNHHIIVPIVEVFLKRYMAKLNG
jgi:hypothetical protein